jgi:hypothetical protein
MSGLGDVKHTRINKIEEGKVRGLPIAHPNSIYLAFACFDLTNEKPSPLPKIMFFFALFHVRPHQKKGTT